MTIETSLFDPAEYLDSPEMIAAYLEAVLDEGEASEIAAALGDIAKAKGMSQIARDAGVSRDSLYKSLKQGGNPTLATVVNVLRSLGLSLSVQPTKQEGASV